MRDGATFRTDVEAIWLRVDLDMRSRGAVVLAVAGVEPGAGATTLCMALAGAAAAGSSRLLLVDASPGAGEGLGEALGLAASAGVGELLAGAAADSAAVQGNGFRVAVLPRGDRAAVERATSPAAWRGVLARLRADRCDRLIVDAGDAASPSGMAVMAASDAVLLVARAGRCRWEQVAAVVECVRSLGPPLLGVVLNDRGFAIPGPLYRRL